jgi:3-methyladenine DNA glycosylase AlkD
VRQVGAAGKREKRRSAFMTLDEAIADLKSLGQSKVREMNIKKGAPENSFGVKMGDVRNVAKKIKADHDLGLELWKTGIAEARLLAILILKPKQLSAAEVERMVTEVDWDWLADWLNSNVVKQHPDKETLRQNWMYSDDPWLARAGWSLTTERVVKEPEGIDLSGLLDRIDREMASAPSPTQWTMNFCLGEIGTKYAEHRQRAIEIGERIGLYSDWPHQKGCIPPYVPVWIREIVGRQASA